MRIAVFADGIVGEAIVNYLFEEYPDDLVSVVTTSDNSIARRVRSFDGNVLTYHSDHNLVDHLRNLRVEMGVLAWWPYVVSPNLLDSLPLGFINTHPSLLPFNRGKHYNFWAIVEKVQFGVSLHFVDRNIDTGDLITQDQIDYDWTDTGESLYLKAQEEMIKLFRKNYSRIRSGDITRSPQVPGTGSFHYAKELEAASCISLDDEYVARDLLNLIRARTFQGKPACWFEEEGKRYEVRVEIGRLE